MICEESGVICGELGVICDGLNVILEGCGVACADRIGRCSHALVMDLRSVVMRDTRCPAPPRGPQLRKSLRRVPLLVKEERRPRKSHSASGNSSAARGSVPDAIVSLQLLGEAARALGKRLAEPQ